MSDCMKTVLAKQRDYSVMDTSMVTSAIYAGRNNHTSEAQCMGRKRGHLEPSNCKIRIDIGSFNTVA